jgi:hypothetical protein
MKKLTYLLATLLLVATVACKKDNSSTPSSSSSSNNNNPPPPPAVTVNSTPQFTGTINDTNYSLVTGAVYSGGTSANKSLGGNNNTGAYQSYTANTNTGWPFLGITKGNIALGSSNFADTAVFDSYFNAGTYSYTLNFNTTSGIQIQWLNSKGDVYSTNQGSGDQTGSSFTITAKRAVGLVYGTYTVNVLINFNCKLYSTTGASITLTNGVYVGPFAND